MAELNKETKKFTIPTQQYSPRGDSAAKIARFKDAKALEERLRQKQTQLTILKEKNRHLENQNKLLSTQYTKMKEKFIASGKEKMINFQLKQEQSRLLMQESMGKHHIEAINGVLGNQMELTRQKCSVMSSFSSFLEGEMNTILNMFKDYVTKIDILLNHSSLQAVVNHLKKENPKIIEIITTMNNSFQQKKKDVKQKIQMNIQQSKRSISLSKLGDSKIKSKQILIIP